MSSTSKHKQSESIDTELDVTEQDPFLNSHEGDVEDAPKAATPLPILQLALLAWIRLVRFLVSIGLPCLMHMFRANR